MAFRQVVKIGLIIAAILALALSAQAAEKCNAIYGDGPNKVTLATGSPGELGLLKALCEAFLPGQNGALCWRKAGSGASLKLLKEKKVDVIMVHAPAAGEKGGQGWLGHYAHPFGLQ